MVDVTRKQRQVLAEAYQVRKSNPHLVEGPERSLQGDPLPLLRELQDSPKPTLGGLGGLVLTADKAHELLRANNQFSVNARGLAGEGGRALELFGQGNYLNMWSGCVPPTESRCDSSRGIT